MSVYLETAKKQLEKGVVGLDIVKSNLAKHLLEIDKQEFEAKLRAEYDELYPEYGEIEQEVFDSRELFLEWKRELPSNYFIIGVTDSGVANYKVEIDYSEDENYITFEEYKNETKIIKESVEATYDEDGIELTTAVAEVTELVRPYVTKAITEEMVLEELTILPSYKEYIKTKRQVQLDNLTVTTATGNIFDANDESRANMNEAITAASILGLTSNSWKLHDNTIVEMSVDEIKEALALGIQAKGSIILNA